VAFTGVHHTGIIVKNLDRSIYFYRDVLGLPILTEPSPWFSGPELATGVGVPGGSLRQCNLQAGTGVLELLEYGNRPADNTEVQPQNRLGAMHIALKVDDLAATVAELRAKGIDFLSEPNVVDEGVLAGWRWIYFLDPDGVTIELVEEAYTTPHDAAIAKYLAERPSLDSLTA
jgi:catechol 2,3-dioxygenase-like lactoylglutathione lyase family enzyme